MTNAATLNFSDYILEIGNQFFNLDENEWNTVQDDLSYETTDRDGLNGYVLKLEETADGYTNKFTKHIVLFIHWVKMFIIKDKEVNNNEFIPSKRRNIPTNNAQAIIQNRVRSRLLDVINEDAELWRSQANQSMRKVKKNTHLRKNQFKYKPLE